MSAPEQWAVRIKRGLVTHWGDVPLWSYEMAEQCRDKIESATGEVGEIEKVLLSIPLGAPSGAGGGDGAHRPEDGRMRPDGEAGA